MNCRMTRIRLWGCLRCFLGLGGWLAPVLVGFCFRHWILCMGLFVIRSCFCLWRWWCIITGSMWIKFSRKFWRVSFRLARRYLNRLFWLMGWFWLWRLALLRLLRLSWRTFWICWDSKARKLFWFLCWEVCAIWEPRYIFQYLITECRSINWWRFL